MLINPEVDKLYQQLLLHPGSILHMLALSDAIEESDPNTIPLGTPSSTPHPNLALAYKWAAVNNKWPFQRHTLPRKPALPPRKVYDWESIKRHNLSLDDRSPIVTNECLLPHNIYMRIKKLPRNRIYGNVNDAFILLARVLDVDKAVASITEKLPTIMSGSLTISTLNG